MLAQLEALERRLARAEKALSSRRNAVPVDFAAGYSEDPVAFAIEVLSLHPDTWQAEVLEAAEPRLILNISRQSGKSTTAAAKAIWRAATRPGATVLLVSPTLRQSQLLHDRVAALLRAAGDKVKAEVFRTRSEFENGSRIVALPGDPEKLRGYTADLVIVDEAAQVDDSMVTAITPTLATTNGQLIYSSTPFGQRGFFFDFWTNGGPSYRRFEVPATRCPRISREFLEEQRQALSPSAYRQEFECSFSDISEGIFSAEDIVAAMSPMVPVVYEGSALDAAGITGVAVLAPQNRRDRIMNSDRDQQLFIGFDIGAFPDYSAVAVVLSTWTEGQDRPVHEVVALERVRGTSYSAIEARVAYLVEKLGRTGLPVTLTLDSSGIGARSSEALLADGVGHFAVTISHTTGKPKGHGQTIAKGDLTVSGCRAFQDRRIRIAQHAIEAPTLVREMCNFTAKTDARGWTSYGASSGHDDTVLALLLALWIPERPRRRYGNAKLLGV